MTLDVSIGAALLAGMLSFLSPCVLPLVPPYLCFITGTSLEELVVELAPSLEELWVEMDPSLKELRMEMDPSLEELRMEMDLGLDELQ